MVLGLAVPGLGRVTFQSSWSIQSHLGFPRHVAWHSSSARRDLLLLPVSVADLASFEETVLLALLRSLSCVMEAQLLLSDVLQGALPLLDSLVLP